MLFRSPQSKPLQFADVAGCAIAEDGVPFPAAVFSLDGRVPTQIDISLLIAEDIAFAARIELLDSDYRVLRSVPFDAFVRRGYSFTGSIFLNSSDNLARVLVMVPDSTAVGRSETSTVGLTQHSTIAVPVAGGVAFAALTTGSEVATRSWLSEIGAFHINARRYALPAVNSPRR